MKAKQIIIMALAAVALASCDLVKPGDTDNPNVDEKKFLDTPGAMTSWVNGTRATFATNLADFILRDEMISDNYYNNYTRISNTLDNPSLPYDDDQVENMQRYVSGIREAAAYGINTVNAHDPATSGQMFTLLTIQAYADVMAGESFTGLPTHDGGEVEPWQEHLKLALTTLDQALGIAENDSDRAYVHTLRARAYYKLGDATQAAQEAKTALSLQPTLLRQVTFDGANGVNSNLQSFIWGTPLQPLPRLDFLDPKYFQTYSTEQRPITIAKAEENYLILAEAAVAQGNLAESRSWLHQLLQLVAARPVQRGLADKLDDRFNSGFKHYPIGEGFSVRASADDPYRQGLILDRKNSLIDVPYISGTSVTAAMIDAATSADALLETIYLMRQEIFLAEGRRTADLGIRLPLCDVEAAAQKDASAFTEPLIPSYIPLNQGMDDFTVDEATKQVTITYNMNHILVQHHATAFSKQ